ncbi:MAG: retroviral-like aspartic protease family protein [Steroidobacteraceae bacterium]
MEGKVIIPVRRRAPTGTEDPRASWSRRRFVSQGLLAMAVAPSLAGASVPAVAKPPDPKQPGSGAVRIGTDIQNRLTTRVWINGRGAYHFLVDTGAERTLLAEEVAAQLALPRGNKVMVQGIIRGQPADLVNVRRLEMGGLVCPSLDVPVLPRAMLDADGYLGLDVLDGRRVILDFRARTLTVTQPEGFFSALWLHGNEAVVRTLGSSGRLRATDCLVDGVRASAFVDTGAEVSVCNPALFQLLQQRAAGRQVVRGQVGLYGVTGGRIMGTEINVDEIVLGRLKLTYTSLVVAGLEVFDLWGLRHEPALLFGMDSLRRFTRVSIDYGRKELRFQLANAQLPQPLQAALPPPLMG